MHVDHLARPVASAQPYFYAWVGDEISLRDVALDAIGHLTLHLNDVFALLLDGLRQSEHVGYLLDDTSYLRLEVLVVVDDAQMAMPRPSLDDLLVQQAGDAQSLLAGRLVATGVVARGIELLGSVGGAHEMEHGVVAFVAQLLRGSTHVAGDSLPHLRLHIGRDVHRPAVADDDGGLVASLCHAQELILQGQLNLERGLLALVEEVGVLCQVVHASLREHGWHFGQGEHFESKVREVFDDAY